MPYIDPKDRKNFDPLIDQLAEKIVSTAKEYKYDGAFAGLLNYTCTRLAAKIIRSQFGKIRYWLVAIVVGTFKNVADEFYRRIASPYEEKQTKKNGDVDVYEEFSKEIDKM
jgi:hypothetical protein